jgi:phosphate-selective porin OprO and OprP
MKESNAKDEEMRDMTRSRWMRGAALAALVIAVAVPKTAAQEQPPEATPAPEGKPADTPKASEPKDQKPAAKTAVVIVTAGPEGFALQSENGDYRLQLRGLVQLDGRFYPSDSGNLGTDTLLLRRARPIMTGSVGKYFEFNLTPDFGGGTASIQDAYFDVKVSPAVRFRAGKFKPSIGIEHLQSDPSIAFVERALAGSIVPNRDVGVQISGDLSTGIVAYALGVFNGSSDGGTADTDTNDSKDLVGRVFFSPFKNGKSPLEGLGFGVSGSTGKEAGAASSYHSGGQLAFFSYVTGTTADGKRTRVSPELSFYSGPVGIIAEYARSRTELETTATSNRIVVLAEAWQATASVFVTGDTAGFGGVKIKKPFGPVKGQWGALQLVARVNELAIDKDAFDLGLADLAKSARKAKAWGVGLNWYLNGNLKQMLSFERTSFTGGAAGKADRPAENALFIRSQVSF